MSEKKQGRGLPEITVEQAPERGRYVIGSGPVAGKSTPPPRRGRGLPEPTPISSGVKFTSPYHRAEVINESGDQHEDVPRRHLIQVSTTVFQGYAFLTDEAAHKLQDQLTAMQDLTGMVYLRATQRTEPTDYIDVDSVIADIRLAIPAKK